MSAAAPAAITPPAQCAACHTSLTGTPLLRCGACKQVTYCNRTCQKAHWKSAHKVVCRRSHPVSAFAAGSSSAAAQPGSDASSTSASGVGFTAGSAASSSLPASMSEGIDTAVSGHLAELGLEVAEASEAFLQVTKPGVGLQPLHWKDEYLRPTHDSVTYLLICSDDSMTPYFPRFRHGELPQLLALQPGNPQPPAEELERRLRALVPAHFERWPAEPGESLVVSNSTPWFWGRHEGSTNRIVMATTIKCKPRG